MIFVIGCKTKYDSCPYKMEIVKKRGMFLVPTFTYPGNDSLIHFNKTFFVTNEITVKEFRPFLNYLKNNKNEVSLFIKYEVSNRTIVSSYNEKLYQEIISFSPRIKEKKENTKNLDSLYYFDAEFDDLVITGLSRKHIEFYLYWLESDTINRNSLRQNFKQNDYVDFRLLNYEEYKSLKYFIKRDNITDKTILDKQLCNLNSSFDELVINKTQTLLAHSYDSIIEINDTIRIPSLGFRIALKNNNHEELRKEKCSVVR